MARRHFTPQQLQEIRECAAQWGKIVARRATQDGSILDLDLDAMEDLAQAAAAGVNEGTLQVLLEQQAQALPTEQPCPDCGRSCPVHSAPRALVVRGGPIQQTEPVAHCPDCRRDFFPPTAPPASR
jgi:hypothetical protein